MAVQAPAKKTDFEKWQDGIDKAVGDPKWNEWDCDIQMAVNEYNRHLSGTTGYVQLDWRFIKAILWVETGAYNAEWGSRPLRIGVPGDPGLSSLLSGNEGGNLILPPAWKGKMTVSSVRAIPTHNIRAGIGYLLMKLGRYEYRTIPDADPKVYEIVVKAGDSLSKISEAKGSTVEMMQKLNPTAATLRPGQVLKYQKASVQRVITGWRSISTATIADRYNGGGDLAYEVKLNYTLNALRKGTPRICTN
ncbi:LysM peptidoglycan-binding domain-containing protein [Achromobacter seleniivolatilans]|uniref:LysM peptidoglycan-binding domain-containing protein n=1 Tax=Achromobacter seleniivolatilans TaxID=3047478 RepID=A0ABY9M3X5_9BURK|nr:LysM peptidoglycan-binding domain-containing protein [Achromobacter sp. R39]WMD20878.1 LysM peptidoglycan-binding domain-containing protein [Achromobacter sp. R39]